MLAGRAGPRLGVPRLGPLGLGASRLSASLIGGDRFRSVQRGRGGKRKKERGIREREREKGRERKRIGKREEGERGRENGFWVCRILNPDYIVFSIFRKKFIFDRFTTKNK